MIDIVLVCSIVWNCRKKRDNIEELAKKCRKSFVVWKIVSTFASQKKKELLLNNWRFRLAARTHASHAWNTG
ncbi:MAG: hypothetical protein MJZ33_09015, partial [Paludibacteraceae bacterium]|nr:hypothetical protein [Paludibacteraceae bacterium]